MLSTCNCFAVKAIKLLKSGRSGKQDFSSDDVINGPLILAVSQIALEPSLGKLCILISHPEVCPVYKASSLGYSADLCTKLVASKRDSKAFYSLLDLYRRCGASSLA